MSKAAGMMGISERQEWPGSRKVYMKPIYRVQIYRVQMRKEWEH